MANPRARMEVQATKLIKRLTGFSEEEENFRICEDFVLSNLFYHHFLDPAPSKIVARVEGLIAKWEIHSKIEKATRTRSLLSQWLEDPIFKDKNQEQFDIQFRLLSLILHSSQSDNEVVSPAQCFSEDDSSSLRFPSTASSPSRKSPNHWLKILSEGEAPFRYEYPEEELSPWSETSSVFSERILSPDRPPDIIFESVQPSVDLGNLPEIQSRYWEAFSRLGHDTFPNGLLHKHEVLCESAGVTRSLVIVVTEYQAIREILWMLNCPSDSSLLFKTAKGGSLGSFHPNRNVSIPSLAKDSFVESLKIYCSIFKCILRIRNFINRTDSGPYTYESFAEVLDQVLNKFAAFLFELEKKVSEQECSFTLLDLEFETKEWFETIKFLAKLYDRGIVSKDFRGNWYKSVRLISVLNTSVSGAFKQSEYELVIECLLRVLRPYFRIADTWISEGRLEDWREEFIYRENPRLGEKDKNFWTDAFIEMPYETALAEEGIPVPSYLPFKKVHVSGKSVHVLSLLGKTNESQPSSLFTDFLNIIKNNLNTIGSPVKQNVEVEESKKVEEIFEPPLIMDDPYLELAFKEIEKNSSKNEVNSNTGENESNGFLLKDYELDVLRPFESVIFASIDPIVEKHYRSACDRLLTFFRLDLKLAQHLAGIRRVFLMEAGDVLDEFYSEVFEKIEEEDSWFLESSNLTLHLQSCVSRRHSKFEAERYRVLLQSQGNSKDILNGMEILYNIDWPLNIVISANHLELYNSVFKFLLKVKRALWALKNIRMSEVCAKVQTADSQKILWLRAWLFHFVGTIHSYFMTRVLHSTEVELRDNLENCKDLDDVIKAHSEYIALIVDRCFLNPSAAVLRSVVLKVLGICLSLKDVVSSGKPDMEALIKLEDVYCKSHQFLATTLRSIVQKRNLPYLEGLVVALVHSCPQKV